MSFIAKGVKAKVLSKDGKAFHGFKEGEEVVSLGGGLEADSKFWTIFEDSTGRQQYLLPYHYKVVEDKPKVADVKVKVSVAVSTEVVDEDLPSKVIYGVVNSANDVIASTFDRDYARELKAALGGKRQGVRIFAFAAVKEIR